MSKLFTIKVTPRAKQTVIKTETMADGSQLLRVYVTTAPEKGKANDAVLKLLAKHLGVAPSKLEVVQGGTARTKVIKVND